MYGVQPASNVKLLIIRKRVYGGRSIISTTFLESGQSIKQAIPVSGSERLLLFLRWWVQVMAVGY